MSEKKSQPPANSPNQAAEQRRLRLAQALRDNLRRRKQQKPSDGAADDTGSSGRSGTTAPGNEE
jgi:hypothetical protein